LTNQDATQNNIYCSPINVSLRHFPKEPCNQEVAYSQLNLLYSNTDDEIHNDFYLNQE
jgi:hypothetical protein